MPLPPVPTTLGALDPVEARNLLDMLDHDGIIPLRRLMKARQVVALAAIRHPETTIERMKYESGALDFILELDGILDGGLQRSYHLAVESQEAAHGTEDPGRSRRAIDREDERGPE